MYIQRFLSTFQTFSYLSAADNPRNRWCVSSSEYTYIELDTPSSDLFQGSLTLEVTGKNTYNCKS